MHEFVYEALPSRVVFGLGSLERLADEVARLGLDKALVLSTPQQRVQAEDVARRLGDRSAGIYDKAEMHVPVEVAQAAREEAQRLGADACVAVGGGSTIGLGKAIALEFGLPIIAVPTTYAGSEMTPIWGLTEAGIKKTGRDKKVLPTTVVYDPALTGTLPAHIAAPSGMNAIAHCIEAMYSETANPIVSMMAEEGVRALARALPLVVREPENIGARTDALYGAYLAGASLGTVGMALHHKLCHTLGGSFNLPHADTHTIMIPHATAYNIGAAPDAKERLSRALETDNPAGALYDLAEFIGAKLALRDLGMTEADLDRAADIAVENPYYNPRPVTRESIRELLDNAYHGRRPAG
ncbi:MAG: maleylacetate reductase [Rhodospirillaceae bacterium]|mgnify:CR=1 FL=1|nr:maleylacetate reductase [Rhodospirillaceae bacterium]